jgi:hypothetical protein
MFLRILKFIWQLPQNLLGLLLIAIFRAKYDNNYGVWRIHAKSIGVSLGDFILLDEAYSEITVKHERGHQKQSLILGPLYLIIIGFSSAICNNLWDRIAHKSWSSDARIKWYYSRFPENSKFFGADYFGKVCRFTNEE